MTPDKGVSSAPLATISMSRIPGEIWMQILESVIDARYVLDTTVPADSYNFHWMEKGRYHSKQEYLASERQRVKLMLVCKGWKAFGEERKWRWLEMHGRLVDSQPFSFPDALSWAEDTAQMDKDEVQRRTLAGPYPRRLHASLRSAKSVEDFSRCFNTPLFSRLSILFLRCAQEYGFQVYETLVEHGRSLPNLRCLLVSHADLRQRNLRVLSATFPQLTSLTMGQPIPPDVVDDDGLDLPLLENLRFECTRLGSFRPENLGSPKLVRLFVPLHAHDETVPESLLPWCRALGSNLSVLILDVKRLDIDIPKEFWMACPRITEFEASLSHILNLAPIPHGHPLKHVINKDVDEDLREKERRERLFANVVALGGGIQVVVLANLVWKEYHRLLDAGLFGTLDVFLRVEAHLRVFNARLQDRQGETRST